MEWGAGKPIPPTNTVSLIGPGTHMLGGNQCYHQCWAGIRKKRGENWPGFQAGSHLADTLFETVACISSHWSENWPLETWP